MSTQSKLVGRSELHPHCYDDWSLCDRMGSCEVTQTYLITGDLADAVRARLNEHRYTDVFMVEQNWVTGYSEYTITSSWQSFTIKCGNHEIVFGADDPVRYSDGPIENPLVALEKWLAGSE